MGHSFSFYGFNKSIKTSRTNSSKIKSKEMIEINSTNEIKTKPKPLQLLSQIEERLTKHPELITNDDLNDIGARYLLDNPIPTPAHKNQPLAQRLNDYKENSPPINKWLFLIEQHGKLIFTGGTLGRKIRGLVRIAFDKPVATCESDLEPWEISQEMKLIVMSHFLPIILQESAEKDEEILRLKTQLRLQPVASEPTESRSPSPS